MTKFCEVIVPLPIKGTFTYRVPLNLDNDITIGQRVLVSFGRSKFYSGIVSEIHSNPPTSYEAKYIEEILDERPFISSRQIAFWNWIAQYYMCAIGDVMKWAIPSAFNVNSELFVMLDEDEVGSFDISQLKEDELVLVETLSQQSKMSSKEIKKILPNKSHTTITNLLKKGIIITEQEAKQKLKPKKRIEYAFHSNITENFEGQEVLIQSLEKTPARLRLFLYLFGQYASGNKKWTREDIKNGVKVSDAVIKALVDSEILVKEITNSSRIRKEDIDTFPINELNEEQKAAVENIKANIANSNQPVLLKGVTGSGKTEVYIQLIKEALKEDGQILFLLPEIGLTTQMIIRLQKHFGDLVAFYHSKFNANEKAELYADMALSNSKKKLIVGARSAIFLPFDQLRLVIVDEEHDASYKQHQSAPRFNARDLAIVLANKYKCPVVLGSATPSLESYLNAKLDKFKLVELNQRYKGLLLPEVQLANMKEERKRKLNQGIFSSAMVNEIGKSLENNKQVILFQNRRGHSSFQECQQCNHVPKCINCDVSLTYHKYNNSLKCHYCSFTKAAINSCNHCGSNEMKLQSFGTEKIEEQVAKLFPDAMVARMDQDTTKNKNAFYNIIESFQSGQTNILIGTQMVSKGLDFDNVSFVGILNGDQMIYFPDFRAHERAFQLMAQVSGRAGRKGQRGKVIIQTYDPYLWVYDHVMKHDTDAFNKAELIERKKLNYPPFQRMIVLSVKHKDFFTVEMFINELTKRYTAKIGSRVKGPTPNMIPRINNYFIFNLTILFEKELNASKLKAFLISELEQLKSEMQYKSVMVAWDVDPI